LQWLRQAFFQQPFPTSRGSLIRFHSPQIEAVQTASVILTQMLFFTGLKRSYEAEFGLLKLERIRVLRSLILRTSLGILWRL